MYCIAPIIAKLAYSNRGLNHGQPLWEEIQWCPLSPGTLSGSRKPQIVPSPIYSMFCPMYTYL